MSWKSVLKPDASVVAGIATVGAVAGIYQVFVGPVSTARATDPNHPALEGSKQQAGYAALTLVAALFLITRDANLAILGGGTIIVFELTNRHAIMADPLSGKMQNPNPQTAYEPAENVIPVEFQGQTA